jgi:hypothetical protein
MNSLALHSLVAPRPAPRELTQARVLFAFLAVQFIAPAISYLATPDVALGTLDTVNRLLGGGPYVATESRGHVWHMLAVGNVMTLGFMCALLAIDLRRFYPTLPALVFLKGFSATTSLVLGPAGEPPLFLGVFVLDGVTTVAMWGFGVRAHRALRREDGELVAPWWAPFLLWEPERVMASLERIRAAGIVETVPNLKQIWRGVMRMWGRILFRSDTVGTSNTPVRDTWRARLFHWRALRLPFLLAERFVAPLDFSGLVSTPERVSRHLLGAHHQEAQIIYDLELLALTPGALAQLELAVRDVVENDTPRTRWLKDLCVHVGYHEALLDGVVRFRRGEKIVSPEQEWDPDITLRGFLRWCAAQRVS